MSEMVLSPKLIVPKLWMPGEAIEEIIGGLDRLQQKLIKHILRDPFAKHIYMMAGSQGNYLSTSLNNLVWGKTAYTGETTYYVALYTAAIDDASHGGTANEAAYTSYARLSQTNNTTIFAAGSGTTNIRTNTFPSDATKSFPTSTGSSATVTYMMYSNGNAGTSADKNIVWCSVTSQAIGSGDTPQIAQNAISYTQD